MEELKPCPFCGGKSEIHFNNWPNGSGRRWNRVYCTVCKIHGVSRVNQNDAIKHWNTRPHPQREALDEEKVYQVLKEWQYDSDEEFVRGQAKAICAKFGATSLLCKHKWSHPTTGYGYQVCMNDGCNVERFYPSLEDLLSALPEVEKAHTYASENADIYRAHDAGQELMKRRVIAALKGLWK